MFGLRTGSRRIPPGILLAGMVLMAFAAAGTVYAGERLVSPDPNTGLINGCYNPDNGSLKLVNPGDLCDGKQVAISWNQTGPHGIQGVPGQPGSMGSPISASTSSTNPRTAPDCSGNPYIDSSLGLSLPSQQVVLMTAKVQSSPSGNIAATFSIDGVDAFPPLADANSSVSIQWTATLAAGSHQIGLKVALPVCPGVVTLRSFAVQVIG